MADGQQGLADLLEIPGFTGERQLQRIYNLVQLQSRVGDCLEIGCWAGRTAACIARAMEARTTGLSPPERLYLIDPCNDREVPDYEQGLKAKWGMPDDVSELVIENVKKYGSTSVPVELIVHTSQEAKAADVIPRTLRFAFIDGDHYLAGCLHDCQWALSLMLQGGILALDDYSAPHWGVREVTELLKEDPRFLTEELHDPAGTETPCMAILQFGPL